MTFEFEESGNLAAEIKVLELAVEVVTRSTI